MALVNRLLERARRTVAPAAVGRLARRRHERATFLRRLGHLSPIIRDSQTDIQGEGCHGAMVREDTSPNATKPGDPGRRDFLMGLAALSLAGSGARAALAHPATLSDDWGRDGEPSFYSGLPPDVVNVKDYGATGDGSTNDTTAFQAALAVSKVIFVPPGNYVLSPSFEITRGTHILGVTARDNTAADYPAFPASRLIFTGNATSGFYSADGSSFLTHGSLRNLVIQTASDAMIDYVIDLRGTVGWTFENLAIMNAWADGGGMRLRALSSNQTTWVNRAINVVVRVNDASIRHAMDFDWSDSDLIGCSLTGGRGTIWRGHGHMHIAGCLFDRSDDAGLVLRREIVSAGKISVVGCSFDVNGACGVRIDANTSAGGTAFGVVIMACGFRNHAAPHDIVFVHHPTQVIRGVIVAGNIFTDNVVPWLYKLSNSPTPGLWDRSRGLG